MQEAINSLREETLAEINRVSEERKEELHLELKTMRQTHRSQAPDPNGNIKRTLRIELQRRGRAIEEKANRDLDDAEKEMKNIVETFQRKVMDRIAGLEQVYEILNLNKQLTLNK